MEKFIPVVVIKELSEVDTILPALAYSGIHTAEITFTDCHLGGRAGVPTTASAKDKVFEK